MKNLLLTTLLLTSCQSKTDLTLYQPDQLFLQAGAKIPTKNGTHVPQFDEIWFSAKKVEDLEAKLSQF